MPNRRVKVFAVWEPILATDWIGPRMAASGRIHDARALQFWDEHKALSQLLGGVARFQNQPRYKVLFDMGDTVWDLALVYPPGVRWDGGKAEPSFAGGAVAEVVNELRSAIWGS